MTTKKFQMWGNSISMRFPKEVVDELGIRPGLKGTIETEDGKIVITPEHKMKKLHVSKELLDWTDKFIETYRRALDALSKK